MDEKTMTEDQLNETIQVSVKEGFGELDKKFSEQLEKMRKDTEERLIRIQEKAELTSAKYNDKNFAKKELDRLVYAVVAGRGDAVATERAAKAIWDKDKTPYSKGAVEIFEKMQDYRKTAGSLNITHMSEGGLFLNETTAPEIYALSIPNSVTDKIRGLNIVTLDGALEVWAEKTLPTVYHKEETSSINASSGTFEAKRMEGKEIMGLYPLTNRAIREMRVGTAQLASSMLLRSFNKQKETDFLRGDGEAAAIQGLYSLAANNTAAAATSTLATIAEQIRKYLMAYIAADDDVSIEDVTFIASEREKMYFDFYVNSTYETRPTAVGNGTLFAKPLIGTNHIPTNLTVATVTNTSEFYAVVGESLIYGMSPELYLDFIPDAAYLNSSGTAVYGASANGSAVRLSGIHDLMKIRNAGVQMLSKVVWGKN